MNEPTSNLMSEKLLNLHDACRLVPEFRPGHPTNYSTLLRWILKGVKAPGGATVRLEAIRLGGRYLTSQEALARFGAALMPRHEDAVPLPRTLTARQRASERDGEKLSKVGI